MNLKQLDANDSFVLDLRQAEKKLSQLADRRNDVQRELDASQKKKIERLSEEADALLDGGSIKAPTDLIHELEVLNVAVERQQDVVNAARAEFSRALCKANEDGYVEVVKNILAAVQALAAANEKELEFFDALIAAGADSVPFRPMRISSIGILRDPYSVAAMHQREVKEFVPSALH